MFECSCIETEPNEFHVAKTITARIRHECCECGGAIKPGDKYEYVSAKSDGGFFTAKTCQMCERIRNDFFSCGFEYGNLWSRIHSECCLDQTGGKEGFFCICPN